MAHENESAPPATERPPERDTEPAPGPPAFEIEHEPAATASSVTTPLDVQREISDAFTAAWFLTKESPLVDDVGMYGRVIAGFQQSALELRGKHALEPVQIIGGAVRWLWDFSQRQMKLPTEELGVFMIRNWQRFEQGGRLMFRAGSPEPDDILMAVTCWLWHFARIGAERPVAPGVECYGARWTFSELVGYMQRALPSFDDQHGQAMRSRTVGRS